MRRLLLALVLGSWPMAAAAQAPLVPVVVLDGRGFGHGVGMAQEGAFAMGAAGSSTQQIFGQFYPGAGLGRARGPVRVPVLDAGGAPTSAIVGFPEGGEVRETGDGTSPASEGFPLRVPAGGQVRLVWDGGRYRAEPLFARGPSAAGRGDGGRVELASGVRPQIPTLPPPSASTTSTTEAAPAESTTTTSAPALPSGSTTTTSPPATGEPSPPDDGPSPAPTARPGSSTGPSSPRPLVAVPAGSATVEVPGRQRRYRGVVEATAASGTLRLVNTVDVETYLKGMGEVRDPSWPPAALRAQAIAARTYALRAMSVGGEVCDTQRCQVYLGAQAEYGAMNQAVDDSREQVLVFGRTMISAVYSANGGGHSASREEGFGVRDDGSAPYLRPAAYPTRDPGAWTVTVALADVAARLGYPGRLTDVRVSRTGASGRALEVTLDGSAGPKPVTGLAFDATLGLRSTLFSLRLEQGAAPAPPPPAEEVGAQAPPEEAATVAAEEVATADTAPLRPPTPRRTAPDDGSPLGSPPEEAAVFAGWAVLTAAGAVFVRLHQRARPHP
ncbi:MAG TPA: SpoIID/LytB domain-containing protein [Acidimicrobiales bacterium]|nr:SpoIID/LytB domain-containing protein [Acidimicrobiales bacterium]